MRDGPPGTFRHEVYKRRVRLGLEPAEKPGPGWRWIEQLCKLYRFILVCIFWFGYVLGWVGQSSWEALGAWMH